MLEIASSSASQQMPDRKEIRIRQPVCVLTDRSAAVRTKICRGMMGGKTSIAEWSSFLFFNFCRDLITPRTRRRRALHKPSNGCPDPISGKGCEREKAHP